MQSPTTSRKVRLVEGSHYHEETKALHIRLDKPESFLEVVSSLRNRELMETISLHLSLADSLFLHEQVHISIREEHLIGMCLAIGDFLISLKEIHICRALSGFIHTSRGAWCPVEAIQVLLGRVGNIESLMVQNLQVYSCRQREEAGSDFSPNPVYLLSESLSHHSSLRRFGWQHSEFIPRVSPTLDPMLESLSTIPKLNQMVIQSPPWTTFHMPTGHRVMQTLIQPALSELHLDGLHLQDGHIKNLLEPQKHQPTLQSLSLSLQLTLGNLRDLGCSLADFLRHSTSTLINLALRLEWSVECVPVIPIHSYRQERLDAIESFENVLACAIGGDSRLQRLELIYYDYSHWERDCKPRSLLSAFRKVLQTNYTLTHLRLPFCGEMDPFIDFLLKLNCTGLRYRLLRGSPSNRERLEGLVRAQELSSSSNPAASADMGLSRVFVLLREMPALFLSGRA